MERKKHYYNNLSNNECILKATLNPADKNFENSLFILKGLAKDGLASMVGNPKKFSDLAKEKLSITELSISEIAYQLGFEYPSSFSKLFKLKTNYFPLEFRQSFN